ncbi:MAG: hypothetical protein K6G80_05305 [Treponema sp.]|nr:hypothetical protein [Treponema sp.]
MTEEYDARFSDLVSDNPVNETSEYQPGVYELKALIPSAEYTVDFGSTRQIQAKTGLEYYSWWLEKASGTEIGSATFDSNKERVFTGGITAQNNYVNILASVTSALTTEYRLETGLTDSEIQRRRNGAHRLWCRAYNEMGDEYFDSALLYVIPALEEDEEGD